jgi:uncharacterized protein
MDDIERRYYEPKIEIREENGQPVIEGMAAIYGMESNDLGGFVEIIEPGFFENVLGEDVRSLWNHNGDLVLGRTRSGTLVLEDTPAGLRTITYPPDTTWGRDTVTSIRRGDVTGMSFAFRVSQEGQRWETRPDGTEVRYLLRGGATDLKDISPVTYPAYPQTSVSVRAHLAEIRDAGAPEPDTNDQEAARSQARRAARRRTLDLKRRSQ